MNKLSIIICTFNRSKLLKETLESVTNLVNFDNEDEVLIIDNNSSDETNIVVSMFKAVKYFKELNQGLSHARNRGIIESKNQILVFLDDDIDLKTDYLNVCRNAFTDNKVSIIGGKVLPYQRDIPDWLTPRFHYLSSVYDLGNSRRFGEKLMGANYAMRKSAALDIGMYNTSLGRKGNNLSGGEEIEYLNRAFRLGYVSVYIPELVVYHKINDKLNKEYIFEYAYQHGKSEVIVDFNNNKFRFLLKIIKGLFICSFWRLFYFKSVDVSKQIIFRYFSGYLRFMTVLKFTTK